MDLLWSGMSETPGFQWKKKKRFKRKCPFGFLTLVLTPAFGFYDFQEKVSVLTEKISYFFVGICHLSEILVANMQWTLLLDAGSNS